MTSVSQKSTSRLTIAAAQIGAERGAVDRNVAVHLTLIERAADEGVGLIVFPELSLTGYELDLAADLQLAPDDPRLEPIKVAAARYRMHVLVSAPLPSDRGLPHIGMYLFSAGPPICYAKIHVHSSETAFFSPGENHCIVELCGLATGLAICADTGYESHAETVAKHGAKLYAASVFFAAADHVSHSERLRRRAERFGMLVLMANYARASGGIETAGRSSIWGADGGLLAQAPAQGQALVLARRVDRSWRGEVLV